MPPTPSRPTTSFVVAGELEVDGTLNHDGSTVGFYGVTPVARQSLTSLTDSTGGTANNTVAAVSGTGDDATINNNFADLANKCNQILSALYDLGLLTT
jgi:hypothetical protein